MKPGLIELSHQITDVANDLRDSGAWREVWEKLYAAYDILVEQIEDEDDEQSI